MDKSEMQGLPQHLIPQLQLLFNQAQHMREIVDMVLDWSSLEADYNKLKYKNSIERMGNRGYQRLYE